MRTLSSQFPFLNPEFPRADRIKDRLQVVIFGAYKPPASMVRLVNFRNHLRTMGYTCSSIVEDFDIPKQEDGQPLSEYFLFKCQFWLENADVVLFVFFKEGRQEGVATEFTHLINYLKGRMWRAVVFTENTDLSTMIRGRLTLFNSEIKQTDFDGDADLYEKATGLLIDYPKKLFFDIRERPPCKN